MTASGFIAVLSRKQSICMVDGKETAELRPLPVEDARRDRVVHHKTPPLSPMKRQFGQNAPVPVGNRPKGIKTRTRNNPSLLQSDCEPSAVNFKQAGTVWNLSLLQRDFH